MRGWDRLIKYEAALSVALISILALLSYGLLLPQLGFYRDDWYLVWTARTMGPQGLLSLFQGDRPLLGWLYSIDFNVLGTSPLGWQIYAFLMRLAGALAFWWLLRTLWPQRRLGSTCMALLFLVYPGFYQQPNATTFKMLLFAYAAAMLSLVLMLKAIKTASRPARFALLAISLLLALLYLYIYEALIALEAVRLLLLWYSLRRESHKPDLRGEFRRLVQISLPFLFLMAGFLFWRLFLFSSTRRATSVDVLVGGFEAMPVHGFLFLVIESVKDWFETTFLAWGVPLYQFMSAFRYRDVLMAMGIGLAGVLMVLGFRRIFPPSDREDRTEVDTAARDWIWLGGLIIIVTTAPIILAGRNAVFAIQWDRYTFQSLLGVALFLGGVLFHSLRGGSRLALLCGLIAAGLMTQYFSAAYYRDFWKAERAVWWQLAWRAPGLQPGTTVVASLPGPYQLAEEYEVWGPLDMIYAPGDPALPVAGQVAFPAILVDLERGTTEQRLVRGTVTVERDYGQALIVSLPAETSCLHVIDGRDPRLSLQEPDSIALIATYSKIDRVDVTASPILPPAAVFGPEPPRDWCYYYQKIGLALQQGDSARAAGLADEALAGGFRPVDQSEWMSVIQAYLANGQVKEAKQAAKFIADRTTRSYLCQQLGEAAPGAVSAQLLQDAGLLCGK